MPNCILRHVCAWQAASTAYQQCRQEFRRHHNVTLRSNARLLPRRTCVPAAGNSGTSRPQPIDTICPIPLFPGIPGRVKEYPCDAVGQSRGLQMR